MIVNCAAYQGGVKLGDISLSEISTFVGRPDCFVWVAVRDPEPLELDTLQEEFGLHELAVEDARHGHQRPKIEEYGRSLFVVLQMIEMDGSQLITGEVAIFAGDNYILSVREHVGQGFAAVRRRAEEEPELLKHGSAYVLYALMDAVVDRYFPVIDKLSAEIEEIEERMFAQQTTRANIEAVYGLKRKIMIVKHATEPLLEAISKLHGGRVPAICSGLQDYFRDIHDHLMRLNQAVDNLRETVTTVISVNLALITMQENEVTKKLAAYAALAGAPTVMAGIWGMNFVYMPEISWKYGYPFALILIAGVDAYLFYRFRAARWL